MVGGDAAPDEPERGGEAVHEVDAQVESLGAGEGLGREESRRARADDGDTKWAGLGSDGCLVDGCLPRESNQPLV